MFFKRKKAPKVEVPEVETPDVGILESQELSRTYIKVDPDTPMEDLVTIQWWLKEEGLYTTGSMPVADILGLAKRRGNAYILIEGDGKVEYQGGDRPPGYREVKFHLCKRVTGFSVQPKTVRVLGNLYDIEELEAALATLETR